MAWNGVPRIGTPASTARFASRSGVWPPNWITTPAGCSTLDDVEHVLDRERLEVQPVGRVVVGRHRLRVAVHHDRRVAERAERHRGVHAAVVELEALADAVRAGAEDQHARPVVVDRLVLVLVRRVAVAGAGLDLGGARVDRLVDRHARPRGARARTSASGAPSRFASHESPRPCRFARRHSAGVSAAEPGARPAPPRPRPCGPARAGTRCARRPRRRAPRASPRPAAAPGWCRSDPRTARRPAPSGAAACRARASASPCRTPR